MLLVRPLGPDLMTVAVDRVDFQPFGADVQSHPMPGAGAKSGGDTLTVEQLLQSADASLSSASVVPGRLRRPVRAVISDSWLNWLTVPWSDLLMNRARSEGYFRVHFEGLLGGDAKEMRYVADDAEFGQPRAVAAIRKEHLDTLTSMALAQGRKLVSLQPLSIATWESIRDAIPVETYILGVIERGSLSLVVVQNRRLQSVVVERWGGDWILALERFIRRIKLREPALAGIEPLFAVDLSGSSQVQLPRSITMMEVPDSKVAHRELTILQRSVRNALATGFDFLERTAPFGGWRSCLLAAGVACMTLTAWSAATVDRGVVALERELAKFGVAGQATVVSRIEPVRREQEAEIRSVNDAIRQLNIPVGVLLRAVQPPRDLRAALLGLDVTGVKGGTGEAILKIMVEAVSGEDMAAYVSYLSKQSPFTGAYLMRHDVAEDRPGRPYRFLVEASWQE